MAQGDEYALKWPTHRRWPSSSFCIRIALLLCIIACAGTISILVSSGRRMSSPSSDTNSFVDSIEQCGPLHHTRDDCEYIKNTSACAPVGRIKYLEFSACYMARWQWLSEVALGVWAIFLFGALSIAADDFFSPNLASLSESLGLSQNVAGVTLLALGNGAPDIFSAMAGISKGGESTSLVIAELFGAGLFITTIVFGSVCITASVQLSRRPFLRDIGFYILACLGLGLVVYQRRIYLWEALTFGVLYFIYVSVVVIGHHIYQKRKLMDVIKEVLDQDHGHVPTLADCVHGRPPAPLLQVYHEVLDNVGENLDIRPTSEECEVRGRAQLPLLQACAYPRLVHSADPSPCRQISLYRSSSLPRPTSVHPNRHIFLHEHVHNRHCFEMLHTGCPVHDFSSPSRRWRGSTRCFGIREALDLSELIGIAAIAGPTLKQQLLPHTDLERIASLELSPRTGSENNPIIHISPEAHERSPLLATAYEIKDFGTYTKPMTSLMNRMLPKDWDDWGDGSWMDKAITVARSPFVALFTYTIPVVNMDEFDDMWNRPLHIVQSVFAPLLLCLILPGGPTLILTCACTAVVCLAVLYWKTEADKQPRYQSVVAMFGFLMSIAWIRLIATEIVSLLTAFGMLRNVGPDIMGITILSWANSVMDFISDMAMAKSGFVQMAIAACLGGPLLNTLIGISLACSIAAYNRDPFPIRTGTITLTAVGFLSITLMVMVVYIPLNRFTVDRRLGIALYAVYAGYLLTLLGYIAA